MTNGIERGRWKPYPAYKPSGVEWLGDIPAHWSTSQLKWACSYITDGSHYSPPIGDSGRSYVTVRDLVDGRIDVDNAARISDEDFSVLEKSGCRPYIGDVLFSKDGTVGKVAVVDREDFVVLSSLAILRPSSNVNPNFLGYFLKSPEGTNQIESWYAGAALRRITLDIIVGLITVLPPLNEQLAIAAFLDRETARLDALIAKHERLIELLQEKRTALISHAVTQGLDPSVPMKASGVLWLGQIPAHWEVMRIGTLSQSLQTGPFGSQLHADDYAPGGIPVINPSHLKSGRIYPDSDIAIDQATWNRLSQHELREGDIVFARRGELGRCAMVTSREASWLCGTGSLRMRPNMNIAHPPFLNHVLATRGIAETLLLESVGSTMDNLNTKILARLPLPVPPIEEQKAITAYLDREILTLDTLIARVREGIEKLREYRAALISAAVTGRIDLRGQDLKGLDMVAHG